MTHCLGATLQHMLACMCARTFQSARVLFVMISWLFLCLRDVLDMDYVCEVLQRDATVWFMCEVQVYRIGKNNSTIHEIQCMGSVD